MSHDLFFIVVVFVYHCINCSVHYAVFFSIKCWQEHHFNSLWKVWSTQFFVFFSSFTCSEFWYKWILTTNGKSFEQGTKTIIFIFFTSIHQSNGLYQWMLSVQKKYNIDAWIFWAIFSHDLHFGFITTEKWCVYSCAFLIISLKISYWII